MLNCTKQSVKNTTHVECDAVWSCQYVRTFRNRTALLWVTAQRVVAISYRRLGTCRVPSLWDQFMGPISLPETSVRSHHYSLRNIPEQRDSHPLRGGSLKSCSVLPLYSMQKTNCYNLPDYTASHTSSLALRNVCETNSATDCCRLPITTVCMTLVVDNAPLNYYLF